MVGVQLGWLADALNWLFNKVLKPVFDWLSNLLSTVFSWVFNTILRPVLEFVFETFLADILHEILRLICLKLLGIMELLLMVVDAITYLFRVFAGLENVTMNYVNKNGQVVPVTGSLLYCIYQTPFVRRAIIALIGVGFGLCFLFALFAVVRSILDFDGKEGHPVSHVLRMTAQAFLKLILVPLFGMFMIVLSGTILKSIDLAFSGNGESFSISRTIFVITTFDAVDVKKHKKNTQYPPENYNTSTGSLAAFDDYYRKRFYDPVEDETGKRALNSYMYYPFEVEKTFDVVKINYLQGYLLCLAFIILLIASILIFICRIFDVILLLITSPLFVAPMPFDDGEHYEKWQELFIGKLFGGYGMIVAMNTYLIVAATLFSNQIRLVPDGQFAVVEDALIKLVFMIGGVFAVLNIGPLVTSILSQTAANDEMTQGAVMSGAMWDAVVNPGKIQSTVRGLAKSKIKGALSGLGSSGKVMSGGGGGQAFSPSRAPKQGRGSAPGLGGAGRAYAMSTMMSTPQRTMKKKAERFSDGTLVDDILNEPSTAKSSTQAFAGEKPAEKPAGKPAAAKPGTDTASVGGPESTLSGKKESTLPGGTEDTVLGGTSADTGKPGTFTGQSTSQASRGSDLGVPPAPAATSSSAAKTQTTQSASQPTLEQDLGIGTPSAGGILDDVDSAAPLPSASGPFDSTITTEGQDDKTDGGKF